MIELEKREKALEDHLNWRKAEEQRLYDEIMETQVKERELDLIKQRVALMREKDAEFKEEIKKAKEALAARKEELKEAQQAHRDAMQMVEKFEEFTKVLDEEAAKEAARVEELEMEEFTPRNRY